MDHWSKLIGLGLVAAGAWACEGEASTTSANATVGSGGSGATSTGGSGGQGGAGAAINCFEEQHWTIQPNYEQFAPTVGSHCLGTNHQDIQGVEKLVFLGDSITQGTPPTSTTQFYRTLLGDQLTQQFPGLEVVECAENGAQVGDLLANQIPQCFPGPEPKRTLVVMTMGGNDVINWPEQNLPTDQATADADVIAAEMRAAIDWFKADPARFPAGVFVVFANVYEFSDGTGNLSACPGASIIGLPADYQMGAPALAHLEEQFMKVAVDTGTDMIFLLEHFCGHGYHRDDPNISCYRGPDAASWFDFTCIHPTPEGHAALADQFAQVIAE
jgi:lysophospholipase L1-like esterase